MHQEYYMPIPLTRLRVLAYTVGMTNTATRHDGTQDLNLALAGLQLFLAASILKLLPVDDRQRELQFADEADEDRWAQDVLCTFDGYDGPPPF